MGHFLNYARSTDLYRQLCRSSILEDGNLLERTDDLTAEAQTEFLRWALTLAAPAVILETGANKGLFAYLLSLLTCNVTLHTFDVQPAAAQAIDLVNRSQQNVVVYFHLGDTRRTLAEFDESVQFAWIDGGHETDVAISDLVNCYRLRIPFVAVDDTAYSSVQSAVDYLRQHAPYVLIENPFRRYDGRGAVLLRLSETTV
jgi:Methyltransferase domain